MWKLRLHFASYAYISQGSWAIYEFVESEGDWIGSGFTPIILAAVQTGLFHLCLKLRAAIGRLPDKDLHKFLVDIYFTEDTQTLASILFLVFISTKCVVEEGTFNSCKNTIECSTFISIFLLVFWWSKLVHGSVKSEWQKDLHLSIEKIAKMEGLSWHRVAQGFLTLILVICGVFLFSIISAEDPDRRTIYSVSLVGVSASAGSIILEVYSSLKAQGRLRASAESGQTLEGVEGNFNEPVEECSWVYVIVCFLLTSIYSALWVCYGETSDPQ